MTKLLDLSYEIETYGEYVRMDVPFVIGVLADLGQPEDDKKHLRDRQFTSVYKDGLDRLLDSIRPEISLKLPRGDEFLIYEKIFQRLADFEPLEVALSNQMTAELVHARTRLVEIARYIVLDPALERAVIAAAKSTDADRDEKIDATLSLWPTDDQGTLELLLTAVFGLPASTPGDFYDGDFYDLDLALNNSVQGDDLPRDISLAYRPGSVSDRIAETITEIDDLVADVVRQVLTSPDFQRLESSWLGLAHLVERISNSRDVKVRVFNVARSELAEDLELGKDSHILGQLPLEFGMLGGEPFGLLVLDQGISPADERWIGTLVETAEALALPLLADATPDLLRVRRFEDLNEGLRVGNGWEVHSEGPWSPLQSLRAARSLAIALPPLVGRELHRATGEEARGFAFQEAPKGELERVWIGAAYAVAAQISEARQPGGWNLDLMRSPSKLEGLPTWDYVARGKAEFCVPAMTAFDSETAAALRRSGLVTLERSYGTDTLALDALPAFNASNPVGFLRWLVGSELARVCAKYLSEQKHRVEPTIEGRIAFLDSFLTTQVASSEHPDAPIASAWVLNINHTNSDLALVYQLQGDNFETTIPIPFSCPME